MGDAALDLALQQQRVEHRADVVHHLVGDDVDGAGFGVDLDLAHMAAVGEVLGLGRKALKRRQAGLETGRKLRRRVGRAHHVIQRHRLVGAGDGEGAVGILDIAFGRLQHVAGDGFALVDDLVRCRRHRAAAHGRRARAAGAAAHPQYVGVALDHADVVGIDAQPFADDLLVDGLVPLALLRGAHRHGHRTALVEADIGKLEARRGGALDGVGDADAAQLAALFRVIPAR